MVGLSISGKVFFLEFSCVTKVVETSDFISFYYSTYINCRTEPLIRIYDIVFASIYNSIFTYSAFVFLMRLVRHGTTIQVHVRLPTKEIENVVLLLSRCSMNVPVHLHDLAHHMTSVTNKLKHS
jgi:hypothetical protein